MIEGGGRRTAARGPRFWPDQRPAKRRRGLSLFVVRPFILLVLLAGLAAVLDPAIVEPPSLLAGEPERIDERFSRCGRGRSHGCVVDGDTFKLGKRSVRIIGIDAPEIHPARCPEEARLGEAATAGLQQWLNGGPFEMVAPVYRDHDQYGRDLRVVRRSMPGGGEQSVADELREAGVVRRYRGVKSSWC